MANTILSGSITGDENDIKFVTVSFDAVTRRSEDNTARISKHPVETGFVISDHVSVENLKLSIEGQISDANNSLLNFAINIISDHAAARSNLKNLFAERKTVTITTPEFTYEDMIITSLVFDKSNPTRKHLGFRLRLEQIRKAKSKTSVVPAEDVSEDVRKAVAKESTSGTGNPKETTKFSSQLIDIIKRSATRS